MNKTLMRISTLALLLMVSMGTWATVGITGTWANGNIVNTGEADAGNGDVTVTLTVTPDNGFYIRKSDIKLTLTVEAGTRANLPTSTQLNGADVLVGDDPDDPTQGRTYTITTDANIIINIDEANFRSVSPIIVSESADNPIYYLIQSYQNAPYYMRTNGSNVNTLNILTNDSKWFFLDAGIEGNIQYYYIVNNNNKYIYFERTTGSGSSRTWAELRELNSNALDKYKFSIAKNSSREAYNICPKGGNTSSLNKAQKNTSETNVQIFGGNGLNDDGSCWNFEALSNHSCSIDAFQVSEGALNYPYRIQNVSNNSYYIKQGATYSGLDNAEYAVTSSSTQESDVNNMKFYLREASSDELMAYYYIIHAETGKYLYYIANEKRADDSVILREYTTDGEENRFQFIIVKGTAANGYNIIAKYCSDYSNVNIAPIKKLNNNQNANISTNGGTRDAKTEFFWNFINMTPQCVAPVVIYEGESKIRITCSERDATIYYTTDGSDPTDITNGKRLSIISTLTSDLSFDLDITNEMTEIKAYSVKNGVSEDMYYPSSVTTFDLTPDDPIITYDASTNQVRISSTTPGATIYYTTDGSEPTTASESRGTTPVSFELSEIVATVRAFAQKGGTISSVTTKACIKQGSGNTVLLQSKENTDFYMTVGDVSNSNTTVNTSSLPQAGMSWHFEDAGTVDGVQYYYIYNTSTERYLQRSGDNLYIVNTKTDTDAFKFSITPYYDGETLSGYNIYSKAASKYVYKNGGNGTTTAVQLNVSNNTDYYRWNIIAESNKSFTALVDASTNSSVNYYTIASSADATFFITTPSGTAVNVTTTNGTSDNQKWYFKAATDDNGWATYYYILNAVTDEAMYFNVNQVTGSQNDALLMKPLPAETDENIDRYKFTLAPTITSGECYIIPKLLSQYAKANYTSIWREGTATLRSNTNRADSKIKWKVNKVEEYVAPPVISYNPTTNEATITCTTPSATIYYTTDGTEPTTASESRGTTPVSFELSEIVATVRAIAQKGGATSTIVTKACIKQGTDNPVMLQSVDCTDFYAVVGDVSSGNTTVNTSSLPQAGMSWYFEDAGTVNGIQYYYICSSEKGTYLQRSGDNLYLVAKQETDVFKFNIVPYFDNGNLAGYNIHSMAVNKFVHKANGNGTYSAVNLNANDYETRSRWNIISVSDRNFPSPITDFSERYAYYTIASSAATGFFMTTPTGTSLYVTTSDGESDSQKWYFQNAGSDGWATYYYIQNAVTGEALYFCKNDATSSQADALMMKSLSEKTDEDADRYMFTIANTVTAGDYYIVPKLLAHLTKTNYTAIWREGTNTLRTNTTSNGTDARNDSRIRWQFTEVSDYVAAPLITYNPQTNKATIISTTPGAIIHYTITGDTPTSSDEESPGEFMLTEGVKTIMAIAVKGVLESNPTSYSIKFQPTIGEEERPYLIQSYDNAWTTGERNFYLIPNDVNNGVKLNTSPLLRASMEWLFIISETEGYYNIKNKSTGVYIHYDSTNGFTTTNTIDVNDDGFKFSLDPYPTTGTPDSYNIRPYGVDTNLHKNYGNTNTADIVGNNRKDSNSSRWNFILKEDVDMSLPIEASSDESGTYYYQIRSNMADDNNYYIASPSDGTVYATVSNTAAANNKTWFFKEVSNDGWVTYFNIVCAETGEYLYCTASQANTYQNGNSNPTKTLEMRSPNTDDNSLFIIVKSYSTDAYYITPKLYKDTQLNIVCSLVNRENKWLLTDLNRNSRGMTWKFEQAEVFCADPIFTEDANGNIIITCVTPASEIRYTTDGSDPAISSPEYANETTGAQILIKAIAKLKNDATGASKSETATLLNMPDIALSQTSYTYDGTAHEPYISKVSITATEGETEVTTGYSVAYSDNTVAGTATVTLTDDTDDNTYIWHASTTFTINPATLTITAVAKEKIYGEDDPELTYTNEGVVTGESLTDILTGSLTREVGEDVGEYTITQGTLELTSTNYTLAYTGANFTISEKSIGEGGYDPASDFTLDIIKNDNGTYNVTLKDGESELISGTEGTDYDFSQSEITDDVSGYYHYHSGTITGANNYTGALIFSYVDVPFSKADGKSQEAGTFVITSEGKGDFATPSGMTAYIVTGISGNTLEVEALKYIPNGVPVLLLSDAAADGFFVHPKGSEETANVSANILEWKNVETHFDTAQIYVLYKGEFVLNIDGDLPAGRVYLPKSSVGVGGARLSIARSRATGIESIPEEQDAIDRWYSIDGRRLSGKPTKKGLYIKNGHKVVIK